MSERKDIGERTIHFGPGGTLIGTLSTPVVEPDADQRRALLLTNAGIIPRVGPHRINVTLARRAAALGLYGFRFDMAGLGDSLRRDAEGTLLQQRVSDIRAAMDQAERTLGVRRFSMIGFCSGADLAHLTALDDARLDSIVLFDPYIYRTPRAVVNHFFRQVHIRGWLHALGLAVSSMRRPRATFGDAETTTPGVTQGRTIFPTREEFARRIGTLVERRVKILFVFSGSSPASYNYAGQFDDAFGRFGFCDRVESAYLPRCDHMLTTVASQTMFLDLVLPWLAAARDRGTTAASS